MAVYVDTGRRRLGHMLMSHMLADTEAELHAMAKRIGVARRHYQGDHYDICQASRAKAVKAGAIPITQREAVSVRRLNRLGRPKPAILGGFPWDCYERCGSARCIMLGCRRGASQ
jgi:hypothetical protein